MVFVDHAAWYAKQGGPSERQCWEEGVKAQNDAWKKQSATKKTEGNVKTKVAKITAQPKK